MTDDMDWCGIVEAWKRKAERAEAERDALKALLHETRLAYWCEISQNSIPSDPPDPLLERLNAVFGDTPWAAAEAALREKP